MPELNKIYQGDCLEIMKTWPDEFVDCVITSPPYWNLRDYKVSGQIGLEHTFQEYIKKICDVFCEVKRVLKSNGTCFINLGDTYGTGSGPDENRIHAKQGTVKGHKEKKPVENFYKSLIMLPERIAIGMCENNWVLRNKIIWHKKNGMPSSVIDRFCNKYEFVYFFVKDSRYYFDLDSIRIPYETFEKRPDGIVRSREYGYNTKAGTKQREEEEARRFGKRRPPKASGEYERNQKGKNPGDVWTLTLQPHPERHIAMFPEKLIIPMVKAGCPEKGIILDPFMGAGTTAVVARSLGRQYLGCELNPEYIKIAEKRMSQEMLF